MILLAAIRLLNVRICSMLDGVNQTEEACVP